MVVRKYPFSMKSSLAASSMACLRCSFSLSLRETTLMNSPFPFGKCALGLKQKP